MNDKERQDPGRIRNAEYWARKQRKSLLKSMEVLTMADIFAATYDKVTANDGEVKP